MSIDNTPETDQRLGHDFDVSDPALAACPYDAWKQFRESGEIVHSDQHGGYYVISRHADVSAAATDVDTFRSFPSAAIPSLPWPPMPLIEQDNPEHHKFRRLVNPWVSASKVSQEEPWIRNLVKSLADDLLARDTFDFAYELARPFARGVALHFIGLPDSDKELDRSIDVLMADRDLAQPHVAEAAGAFLGAIGKAAAERRQDPREDLISGLVAGTVDGEPLTDEQVLYTATAVTVGGLDTTMGALSIIAKYLLENPADRQRLVDEPDLLDSAIEEFIRWSATLTGTARTVSKDVEFAGCPMKEGDRVWILWASGSRDPEAFENPDDVHLDRRPNKHLGFGLGPHRCVGSHVAKGILRVAISELAGPLGEFEIADPDQVTWFMRETRGISHLPIRRKGTGA